MCKNSYYTVAGPRFDLRGERGLCQRVGGGVKNSPKTIELLIVEV